MTLTRRHSKPAWTLYQNPGLTERAQRFTERMNSRMLLEDLGNRHYAYNPTLQFESEDPAAAEEFLCHLLIENSHTGRDRADLLFWDFFEAVEYDLFHVGRCTAELFLEHEGPDQDSETEHPRLAVLPQWTLKHRRRRVWQLDPTRGIRWRSLQGATLIEIKLGRPQTNDLQRTRRRLAALDQPPVDRTTLLTSGTRAYEFALHQRKLDEMSARATSAIGWDGRGLYMKRATDSLRVYRELRFTRTWLDMVAVALTALDGACRSSGSRYAPRAIKLQGIPTADDLDDAMRAVTQGSESLDAIKSRLLYPRRE